MQRFGIVIRKLWTWYVLLILIICTSLTLYISYSDSVCPMLKKLWYLFIIAYLNDISDVALFLLMPTEDFRSRPLRFLLRELIVENVFIPLLDILSNPKYIDKSIVWLVSLFIMMKVIYYSLLAKWSFFWSGWFYYGHRNVQFRPGIGISSGINYQRVKFA